MIKKTIFILLAIGLLAFLGRFFLPGGRDAAMADGEQETTAVELRDVEQNTTLRGNVAPVLLTEIRSEVSGRVARIPIEAGATVKRGDPLIELDQSQIQAEMTEADLRIMASALRVEQSERDLDRRDRLAEKEFINRKELEDANTELLLAKNAIDAERARKAILEERLSKTTIRAPYDGTVLSLAARPGLVVTGADSGREGTVLMEIADLSRLRIDAQVIEVDAVRLAEGNSVMATFESLPGLKVNGQISFISPAARKPTGSNDDTRFFTVEIELLNPDQRVRPGLSATARIVTDRRPGVPTLPLRAVFFDPVARHSYVYLRTPEGRFDRRKVEIGLAGDEYVEVLQGLAPGDTVALTRPAWDSMPGATTTGGGRGGHGR